MKGARSTVDAGIANGIDPAMLYLELADAAQAAKQSHVAETAIHYAPTFQDDEHLATFILLPASPTRRLMQCERLP
jgi:hypothetical protein